MATAKIIEHPKLKERRENIKRLSDLVNSHVDPKIRDFVLRKLKKEQ